MQTKKFNLTLRPSRTFFTLISGVHLVILFLACIADFPWWLLLGIFIFIGLSYYYLIYKYIYRKSNYAISQLWQNPDTENPNQWILKFYNNKYNKTINARLKPKGYLSDFMIIMHFNIPRQSKYHKYLISSKLLKKFANVNISVIIFPDMIDSRDFHNLKLYLTGYS